MPNLFISQEWVTLSNIDEKVTIDAGQMVVKADGKAYRLTPAVRFLKVDGGDGDPHQLLGKVKTTRALEAMDAETMAESVILGETAYRVMPGFSAMYTGTGSPVSSAFK